MLSVAPPRRHPLSRHRFNFECFCVLFIRGSLITFTNTLLHCALSLAVQCIVIGPVCDTGVCNGQAGSVRTLPQPAHSVCVSLRAFSFFRVLSLGCSRLVVSTRASKDTDKCSLYSYNCRLQSWPGSSAVSPQVTETINLVEGWHYFPPGLRLSPQPPSITTIGWYQLYCSVTDARV